jgi:antitoxin VapB
MASSIRNKRAEAAVRDVARVTGESLTTAILHSLEDRLARIRGRAQASDMAVPFLDIGRRCVALPDLDTRFAGEILGYRRDGTVG